MKNQNLEVSDIFREHGHLLNFIPSQHQKVVQDIIKCRTASLGGHLSKFNKCGNKEQSYNSCRSRHCPKCQFVTKTKWVDKRKKELLPVDYFHVVFTLPSELNALILQNKEVCYNILFKSVSKTLKEVASNPKNLGADIGYFMVLHTWGQNLLDHPHLHVVVPSGGVTKDKKRWIHCKKNFFLPLKILSMVYRAKFLEYTKKSFDKGELKFSGRIEELKNEINFKNLLSKCCVNNWVVYAKRPFSGPAQVLNYLGNYTHRIAISNHRLIKVENEKVYFRYKDYANESAKKVMVLGVKEFMRRFLLHVLPKGFMRIRHYGIFGNKYKAKNIEICRALLFSGNMATKTGDNEETTEDLIKRVTGIDIAQCPKCEDGKMISLYELGEFQDSA